MKQTQPPRWGTRTHSRRAFTLIELLIVILILAVLVTVLIVAILPLLGNAEKRATEARLQEVGNAMQIIEGDGRLARLYRPDLLEADVTEAFARATGIRGARTWDTLNPVQRAKLLAFVLSPSQAQWEKISSDPAGRRRDAPIKEENARDLLREDSDGFAMLVDAWGNPVIYTFIEGQAMGVAASVPWVLSSGGKDGKLEAQDDNLNWSPAKNSFEGSATE